MKEGKRFKKLLLGLAAAAMTVMCAMPVSAATRSFSTSVKKGECVHIVNENISGNAISNYILSITPKTSGTRYDIVYAYSGEALALKNCRKASGNIKNSTYFKANKTANRGIIACIKAVSGSVDVKVTITSKNSKASVKKSVMKNHSPLKSFKVTKGRKLWLKRNSSNITTLPVVIAAQSGTAIKRTLTKTSYETYNFKSSSVLLRRYVNNKRKLNKNRSYSSTYGKTRYYSFLVPANSKGTAYTGEMATTKGTATYYYPADYLNVVGGWSYTSKAK